MGDNDGEVSQEEKKKEKDKKEHAHENSGHDHRDKDKRLHEAMGGKIVTIEQPGAEGTEESGEGGGDGSDEYAIAEGLEKHWVVEKGITPFEGEVFPSKVILDWLKKKER